MRNMLKWATILLPLLTVLLGCGTKGGDDGQDPQPLLTGKWTWISGAGNGEPPTAVCGTKGVPDPANVPGGRPGAASWIDAGGKLWLFGGGTRIGGIYNWNDLWRFDPATREWTWMSGSDDINQPGVYGTKGVADAANVPISRQGASSWIDPTGKFWLFGGDSVFISSVSYRNDLWRFDPATLEWTWMSGSSDSGVDGAYGRKGLAGPAGGPGARYGAASWVDSRGKLWLFGGERGNIDFSDLWQYDPATRYWTWVSGSASHNQPGIYGTKGIPDPANSPGARHGAAFWIDVGEKLWLASGQAAIGYGGYNDLWHFTIDPR